MSNHGTTYYDDQQPMDWQPEPRAWCDHCCSAKCGCEPVDAFEASRVQHYDGMGVE